MAWPQKVFNTCLFDEYANRRRLDTQELVCALPDGGGGWCAYPVISGVLAVWELSRHS